jgi:hypothetical protein
MRAIACLAWVAMAGRGLLHARKEVITDRLKQDNVVIIWFSLVAISLCSDSKYVQTPRLEKWMNIKIRMLSILLQIVKL